MPEEPTPTKIPAGQSSEQELIRRINNGERELFYELVRPHEHPTHLPVLNRM